MRKIRRAIITGPTGAIGVALIKELISHGIEILAIVREQSKRKDNIPVNDFVSIIECSLNNLSTLENKTGKDYDVLFHFAWEGTSGIGRENMYLQNLNVKYSLDAVSLAKRFGCKLFIGAGSQAEYGRQMGLLKSDTPTLPESGYGYAKLCAGYMTRGFSDQLGLEHIWVRILSVYGPKDGAQSLVMSAITAFKQQQTFKCTKGEQIWDYLYSEDAARMFYNISIYGENAKIYVIGSGACKTLKEYIEEIRDIVNKDAKIEFGAIPYNDKQVMFLQCDVEELNSLIRLKKIKSFSDGIKDIIS